MILKGCSRAAQYWDFATALRDPRRRIHLERQQFPVSPACLRFRLPPLEVMISVSEAPTFNSREDCIVAPCWHLESAPLKDTVPQCLHDRSYLNVVNTGR